MLQRIAPALLLLAACSSDPDQAARSNISSDRAPSPVPAEPAAPSADVADPRTAKAAHAVLVRHFDLMAAGKGREAAGLWWDRDRAAAFASELRRFGDVRPSIADPGRIEGAAGSAYVEISLQLLSGGRALSDGTAVLRRVNDVPGSSAEQRRWRIDRITLQPPPVPLEPR